MDKWKKNWKWICALLVLGLSAGIWTYKSQLPVPVSYLQVQKEVYKETFLVSGKVQLDNALSLQAEAKGQVKKVLVQAGKSVKAGDLLVVLGNKDAQLNLRAAQSDYKKAVADLSKAGSTTTDAQIKVLARLQIQIDQLTKDMKRAEQLYAEGVLSSVELDAAKQDLALKQAESDTEKSKLKDSQTSNHSTVISAQADVTRKQVQIQVAELQLSHLEIRAPFDGVVIKSDLKPGETVNMGDAVVFMAKSFNKYCEINPDEKYLPLLKVGQSAFVYADQAKDKPIQGKVVWMAPQVDRDTGTLRVKISLEEDRPWLIQNLLLRCEILTATYRNSLVLPIEYIKSGASSSSVLMERSGKVEEETVTISHVDSGKVRVLSGLQAGDRILKPEGLKVGMKVRLVSSGAGDP